MKNYVAEFIGTFVLALAISFSLGATGFPVPTPVIAALALGYGVYAMGSMSGGHFNPAITLGALAIRKIDFKEAVFYWIAQFFGAAVAMYAARFLVDLPEMTVANNSAVMISELLGTFVFAFGVAAVMHGRVSGGASGLVVGISLLLGISMAAGSNGMLNPAVALAVGSFSMSYLIGPFVGAAAAMFLYNHLSGGCGEGACCPTKKK